MTLDKKISQTKYISIGENPSSEDINNIQNKLLENGFAQIPQDYIELLCKYNGISFDDGNIYGISATNSSIKDIYKQNKTTDLSPELLILGEDSFDFLVYNKEKSLYQIIDSTDMEVLEVYTDINEAILYIIKI